MRAVLILLVAGSIAACGERRPPAPTAEQNAQLNDAGAMLNDMAANEAAAR